MPALDPQTIVFVVCVGLFTLAAACTDLFIWKVPNKLTVPMFFAGFIYQGAFNGFPGLLDGLYSFLIGFGVFFIFFAIGISGGGDVKLVGALSVWLGLKLLLPVLVVTTAMVVVIHVGFLVFTFLRRGARGARKWIQTEPPAPGQPKAGERQRDLLAKRYQGKVVMGYAVPVALATWVVLLWKWPTL